MKRRILSLAAAAALLWACSDAQEAPPETRGLAAEGAALLAPFKSSLMQALSAGMEEGPAAAIDVCSVKAPRIADELSVDGVRMGRSSHKLRNPKNAPPDWLVPVLASYTAGEAEPQPTTVGIAADRHGYVEPILTQPLCLTCHGSNLDAGVAASIAERYPEDRATGFEVGDLRGVFWVEF